MNATFTFAPIADSRPADLSFDFGDFAATSITVKAETQDGAKLLAEMFGEGATSFELPKSKGEDFARFAQQKGLKV